jgi:hypothetical protein
VSYTELAKLVEQPAVVSLLRAITRQERGHFAFFLAAARARAETMSRFNGLRARRILGSVWEPVGVPSLGIPLWRTIFAPLVRNADFCARLEGMDRVVDTIPHLEGLNLMRTFLQDCAAE